MPTLSARYLALAIAVAAVVAGAPASAKGAKLSQGHALGIRHAKSATPHCRGGNLFPCGPVYFNDHYLGTDPDPFIRQQLLRMYGHTASAY
jgi:hypothetical protein